MFQDAFAFVRECGMSAYFVSTSISLFNVRTSGSVLFMESRTWDLHNLAREKIRTPLLGV